MTAVTSPALRPATALRPHHWDLLEAFHPAGNAIKVPNDLQLDGWLRRHGANEDTLFDLADEGLIVEVGRTSSGTIGDYMLSGHGQELVKLKIRPYRLLLAAVDDRGRRGLSLPDAQLLVDIWLVDDLLRARLLQMRFADHKDPDNTSLEDAHLGVWLNLANPGKAYLPRKDR